MKHPLFPLALCLAMACTDGKPGDSGDASSVPLTPFDADLADAIRDVATTTAGDLQAGGIVVGVSLPGIEPFLGAVGTADEATGRAMDPMDRFRIGSITKTFVAAVVLDLVDEGMLSLGDAVSDHVSGVERSNEMTIRHLLNHTSGLKDYSVTPEAQAGITDEWTDAELIALVAGAGLLADPGTGWSYSNTNYVVLGMIIESATGEPWSVQVEDRLIDSLGLDQTRAPGPGGAWGDTVPGYVGAIDYTDSVHPSMVGAAGSIESTAADLLTWGDAFMGGAIHSDETHDAQYADMVSVIDDVLWMALGVFRFDDAATEGPPEVWHNGAINGYGSWLGHKPDSGATVVALVNCWPMEDTSPYIQVSQDVAQAIWPLIDAIE